LLFSLQYKEYQNIQIKAWS